MLVGKRAKREEEIILVRQNMSHIDIQEVLDALKVVRYPGEQENIVSEWCKTM